MITKIYLTGLALCSTRKESRVTKKRSLDGVYVLSLPISAINSDFLDTKYFKIPISLRKHHGDIFTAIEMRHFGLFFSHCEVMKKRNFEANLLKTKCTAKRLRCNLK